MDSNRWTHNVQLARFAFPPFADDTHHEKLVAFARDLNDLLCKHDLPLDPSFIGFYRADADWDNIEHPDSCVNYPTRGKSAEGIDNEP
jgi:hypothetical protein